MIGSILFIVFIVYVLYYVNNLISNKKISKTIEQNKQQINKDVDMNNRFSGFVQFKKID